jgi:hypothetical protein
MHDTSPTLHNSACLNCSATLVGPYCAQCGQHAHESARSLHVLFHDAWHLITHLDGRVWNTLVPLLIRPGRLTREYFADHRARYVPPFRLYFIISVAFFGLASLTTGLSKLGSIHTGPLTAEDRADIQKELQDSSAPAVITQAVDAFTAQTQSRNLQLDAQLCSHLGIGVPWLDLRLQATCKRQAEDQGKSMMHAFGGMVPKMMFVFLPLMALVMLALYHFPPRYYVEHLVFLLHLQSNLFLAMILGMLITAAAEAWPLLDSVASIATTVLFWYALWYTYMALRTYYAQSWTKTLAKFIAVFVAYFACGVFAVLGTMVISALVS